MATQTQALCATCSTTINAEEDKFCRNCGNLTPLGERDVASRGGRQWPTSANTAQAIARPEFRGPAPSEESPASAEFQSVEISHEVVSAAFRPRLAASMIDLLLAGLIMAMQSLAADWWIWNNEDPSAAGIARWALFMLWPWIGFGALQLYGVAMMGQTMGKRLVRIRVVDEDTGEPVEAVRNLTREMVKLMLFPVIGWAVQLYLIAKSPTHEGVHDRLVGTLVVKMPRRARRSRRQKREAIANA